MHPADIKAELQKRGKAPARIAEKLSLKPSTVSKVLNGHKSSRRVADAIAGAIGRPVSQIWPGRYDLPARKAGGK